MKTLGFEMVDAGFEVAVGRSSPAGAAALAERLDPPGTVPAVVLQEENALHFGAAAEQRRFLFPRQLSDGFWDEFSLQPSALRQRGRALSFSELAFDFLRHLVNGLPGVASEHEALAVALPAPLIDDGPRAEERVGMLLAICRDLELKIATIVDAACAALLDPESTAPARGLALVVDIGLHAAVLTAVDIDGAATRRAFTRVPGAGWLALTEQARRSLAARFLRQTSFDVTVERQTEQEFHNETLAALAAFTSQPEAWLRITSAARERAVSVSRDALSADLKTLAETIAENARDLASRNGFDLSSAQVYLTARARHVCGLATALRARGALSVTVLTAGAAARGAAALACTREVPAELEDVPVETALVLPGEAEDQAVALRAAFSFHRHGGMRDGGPTHVVLEGIAHPLRPAGLRVATGGDRRSADLAIPISPHGIGRCEIVIETIEGRWQAAALLGNERVALPGGDAPLAPGDVLEIHGDPGAARLLFVRIAA